jgi:uncharacterized delta-60 repeat protein
MTYDNVAPTVTISSTAASSTNVSPIPVTITFSESVTGFIDADVTVTNGTKSGFSGSGTTYTVNVTPTAQGAVTVNVAANVAQDSAGNNNTAATQLSRTFDSVAPTVAITSSPASGPTNNSAITLTFTFSEAVTGFTASDVSLTNATAGTFTATSSTVYTLGVTATGSNVTANVAANAANDNAGNGNTAATQLSITYDNSPPTVAITSIPASGPTNNSAITLTFTFSEAVTGFIASDVSLTNATAGTFTATSSTVYTLAITATGSNVTANVAANAANDTAGNGNTAATQWSITYDTTPPNAPTVTGTTPTSNTTPTWTWTSGGGGGNGTYRYKLNSTDLTTGATQTTSTSFTSGTALSEATHTLYVQERDAAGNWSTSGSFAIQVVTPPAAPTLASPIRYVSALGLSWSSVTGATAYNLYWSTTASVALGSSRISNVTSVYNHGSLPVGLTYYYRLAAVKNGVESVLSNEVSASPYTYAAPTLTSVSPNSGSADGGTTVSIAGTGFQSGMSVSFGGAAAASATLNSSTSITATTPVGSVGAQNVVVTNPDGQTGTLVGGFTYVNSPKVYFGGEFLAVDPNLSKVPYIASLNSNGTLNTSFSIGTGFNGIVRALMRQTDGKILVGGEFTTYNGSAANRIIRLNSNGSIDSTFTPGTAVESTAQATSPYVGAIAIQSDGKILIGGQFASYAGSSRNSIIRLNTNGTLDTTFNIGTGIISSGYVGTVSKIVVLSSGKILVAGNFTTYNGTARNHILRLNSDGSLDTTFTVGTGFGSAVSTLTVQSDNKIIAGGGFTTYNGTTTNRIARLNADGTIDSTFGIGTGFSNQVYTAVIQSDGKILVGGMFNTFNGVSKVNVARLNTDGSLDTTLTVPSQYSYVVDLAIQADGKILAGGMSWATSSVQKLGRFNSNGTLDSSFDVGKGMDSVVYAINIQSDGTIIIGGQFTVHGGSPRSGISAASLAGAPMSSFNSGTGVSDYIKAVAIQTDGKVLVGGYFTTYNGVTANCIARITSTGVIDSTFVTGTGFNVNVQAMALQSDGKIVVGGQFTSYNGTTRNRIARLNSDGSLDTTFTVGTGFDAQVHTIVIQSDGKILVGGAFATYAGTATAKLARLNANGTLDTTFTVGTGFNNDVQSIAVQSDGKVLVGGWFTTYNGGAAKYVVRLSAAGAVDSSFVMTGTGFDSFVYSVAVQADGKVIIGGSFTTYNGVVAKSIARLNSSGAIDSTFNTGSGFLGNVLVLKLLSSGKIMVVGSISMYNGVFIRNSALLNSDGTRDSSFDFGVSGTVRALAIME